MAKNRLYNWSEDSIRWYRNAEAYDRFHPAVAELILAALPENPRIMDVGCGIGSLAIPLSAHCSSVTACDILPRPLEVVNSIAAERGIHNIETVCSDFMQLSVPQEKYDALVFCRFGRVKDFAERAMQWTKGKVFFVQNAAIHHSFDVADRLNKSVDCFDGRGYLCRLGAKYKIHKLTSEMGQPFTDREDAARFISFYDGEGSREDNEAYLDRRLISNDDAEFPLFLPSEKHFVVFEIDAL